MIGTLVVIGAAVLLSAFLGVLQRMRLRQTGCVVIGRVVAWDVDSPMGDDDSPLQYVPTVRFALPDGTEVEYQSEASFDDKPWRVGDEVRVTYDPEFPSGFLVDSRPRR